MLCSIDSSTQLLALLAWNLRINVLTGWRFTWRIFGIIQFYGNVKCVEIFKLPKYNSSSRKNKPSHSLFVLFLIVFICKSNLRFHIIPQLYLITNSKYDNFNGLKILPTGCSIPMTLNILTSFYLSLKP